METFPTRQCTHLLDRSDRCRDDFVDRSNDLLLGGDLWLGLDRLAWGCLNDLWGRVFDGDGLLWSVKVVEDGHREWSVERVEGVVCNE